MISFRFEERKSIPRSSAYRARKMCSGMCRDMSLKKMLNRVADMQLPCGTPVFVVYVFELIEFQDVR